MNRTTREAGAVQMWTIVAIIFISTTVIATGAMIWAMINYYDQKTNVDGRVAAAVLEAEKKQADELEAEFLQREKEPNRLFAGPEDYGSLSFNYPKTWSVFVESDTSKGDVFQAYLHPITVPPISNYQQFALRVTIETKDYDKVLSSFSRLVEDGDLKTSSVKINGETGTRLEGKFSEDIRGSAIVFRIRDKTVTVRTDANTFNNDFNKIISTIKFIK